MDTSPQSQRPAQKPAIAIGAGDLYPVVLIEVSGAIGALFAERRCPNETLEKVVYFRSLMGEPHALFLHSVELATLDGYFVAMEPREKGIFYEPSRRPYEIRNIAAEWYNQFVDHIVNHDAKWVEEKLSALFSGCPGFSMDAEGRLAAPEDYARGLDAFLGQYPFVEPKEAKGKTG